MWVHWDMSSFYLQLLLHLHDYSHLSNSDELHILHVYILCKAISPHRNQFTQCVCSSFRSIIITKQPIKIQQNIRKVHRSRFAVNVYSCIHGMFAINLYWFVTQSVHVKYIHFYKSITFSSSLRSFDVDCMQIIGFFMPLYGHREWFKEFRRKPEKRFTLSLFSLALSLH